MRILEASVTWSLPCPQPNTASGFLPRYLCTCCSFCPSGPSRHCPMVPSPLFQVSVQMLSPTRKRLFPTRLPRRTPTPCGKLRFFLVLLCFPSWCSSIPQFPICPPYQKVTPKGPQLSLPDSLLYPQHLAFCPARRSPGAHLRMNPGLLRNVRLKSTQVKKTNTRLLLIQRQMQPAIANDKIVSSRLPRFTCKYLRFLYFCEGGYE